MPSRYDSEGYNAQGRRKIGGKPTQTRDTYGGLDEFYALQNRAIPAFERAGGPQSANEVARSYRNQGLQLGPKGIQPRMYGAPQQPGASSSQEYSPVYTSDNVDSSSFGAQISQARKRAESGDTGIYTPPAMRTAPNPVNFAADLGSDSLIGVGGYKGESPVIMQNDFNDTQSLVSASMGQLDKASSNRLALELMRDAKRGNPVNNKTSTGSEINSNYGTASAQALTPEQFANRPQATIEGEPASEWFKRSAARQNTDNKFSTVSQGQDFLGDERRRNESEAAKNVAEGNKISDELRKRRVPSARSA